MNDPQKELNIMHESLKEIIGGLEKSKNLQSGGTIIWYSRVHNNQLNEFLFQGMKLALLPVLFAANSQLSSRKKLSTAITLSKLFL